MAILTREELAAKFRQSRNTVLVFCRMSESPAYKNGAGENAPWMCDEEKYEEFMRKQAEKFKG